MMIPGLSGGSFAILLGIYENIIDSLANINFKKILYLAKVGFGLLLGVLFFSKFLFTLTELKYFNSLVKIILSINIILILFKIKKIKIKYLISLVVGSILMFQIKNLNIFLTTNILMFIIVGFLLAISLILPGLGATYFLYAINMYDTFNIAISNFDFVFLSLIGLSTIAFILLTTKVLNYYIMKDINIIYSIVTGLLLASLFN